MHTPNTPHTSPSQHAMEAIRAEAIRRENAIVKLRNLGLQGPDIADWLKVPVVNVRKVVRERKHDLADQPLDLDTFHFLAIELSVLLNRSHREILNRLRSTGKYPDHYFASIHTAGTHHESREQEVHQQPPAVHLSWPAAGLRCLR